MNQLSRNDCENKYYILWDLRPSIEGLFKKENIHPLLLSWEESF